MISEEQFNEFSKLWKNPIKKKSVLTVFNLDLK